MKSIQLCTLPITVKGLPRNSKVTDTLHTDNCDGSDNCSCKDKTDIRKQDIFNTFLTYTEDESAQLELLKQEAIWGMNFFLHHSLVKPIMDLAAETYQPLDTAEEVTGDLMMSFHDMSLHEVEGIDGERDQEISVSAMSLGEEYNEPGQLDQCDIQDRSHKNHNDDGEDDDNDADDDCGGGDDHDDGGDDDDYDDDNDDDDDSDPGTDTSDCSSESSMYSDPELTDSVDKFPGSKIDLFEPDTPGNQLELQPELDLPMYSPPIGQSECNSGIISAVWNDVCENESTTSQLPAESSVSSFVKYDVPALLCRHPPPAIGRDDDINVLRTILDELIIKSGQFMHSKPNKEKILLALDHKIANNIFKLMEEPPYRCLLPEFPVLHLLKSKITNLLSAYECAGIRGLLKYMKDDDEETDWKKLVSLAEIECAAGNIRRLSVTTYCHICYLLEESYLN